MNKTIVLIRIRFQGNIKDSAIIQEGTKPGGAKYLISTIIAGTVYLFHQYSCRRFAANEIGILSPDLQLKQSFDLALVIEADIVRRRHTRQAGHGHDIAADCDDELGTG